MPYLKTDKKRAPETTTVQDTPQDMERMKITPALRGMLIKKMIRNAKAVQDKAIIQENCDCDQKEPIEDCDCDVAICRSPRCRFRHHFTSPDAFIAEWKDLLLDCTHEGKNFKKRLWDTTILDSTTVCNMHGA
jgi:hypothetical protein